MATTDARPLPKQNTAFRLSFYLRDTSGNLVTGAGGWDSEVSKDAAAHADCTNEVAEIGGGLYGIDLTAAEMNAYTVGYKATTTAANCKPVTFVINPATSDGIDAHVRSIATSSTAATKLATGAALIREFTVDGTGSNTTTQTESAQITEANALHWSQGWLYGSSGTNTGVRRAITNYTFTGGRGRFTHEAFPEAFAGDDTVVII